MDRRRFLAQGLAASSVCAMPLSLFAKGTLAGYVYLRSGRISTQEFKLALKEAQIQSKGVLLHPHSVVLISESIEVETSLVGSGGTIKVQDGSQLSFVNPTHETQVITGLSFEGSVSFKDSKHQIVSLNSFNMGLTAINVTNFQFKDNKVESHFGHGIHLVNDIESVITNNTISLYGPGHYVCLEETMKASLASNQFVNKTSGLRPSLIVNNSGDVNPQMELKNNNLV